MTVRPAPRPGQRARSARRPAPGAPTSASAGKGSGSAPRLRPPSGSARGRARRPRAPRRQEPGAAAVDRQQRARRLTGDATGLTTEGRLDVDHRRGAGLGRRVAGLGGGDVAGLAPTCSHGRRGRSGVTSEHRVGGNEGPTNRPCRRRSSPPGALTKTSDAGNRSHIVTSVIAVGAVAHRDREADLLAARHDLPRRGLGQHVARRRRLAVTSLTAWLSAGATSPLPAIALASLVSGPARSATTVKRIWTVAPGAGGRDQAGGAAGVGRTAGALLGGGGR